LKINRLFSIVHILLNKKRVTASALAKEFEVSTRTIYRDIETLSMSGIPIYTDKGNGGGISLLNNFVLDKSVISEEEKNSILLGLEVLKTADYNEHDAALKNLKKMFSEKTDSFIEVDFAPFDNNSQKFEFEQIKEALKKSQTLEMTYRNKTDEHSVRCVDPLKLIFKKKRWYLVAFCHSKKDYRTFRISRMEHIKIMDTNFDREKYNVENLVLTSFESKNTENIILTLDKKALFRVEEELFSCETKVFANHIIVSFQTEIDEWMTNYIMSYADFLIDCSPAILKKRLKEKAKKILKL
jgi:predicted DNA-binding transcriptional regulator YafY